MMRSILLALAVAAALVAGPGLSQPAQAVTAASPWQQVPNARVRLVAATLTSPEGVERLVAGLHIVLEPGWKTYWRTPGDSGGMPPELDWDQSLNVASARLHHPAPHRFADAMGTSIGYKDEVLFPISIARKAKGEPVELRLGAVLGICKDICIPVDSEISLSIPAAGPSDAALEALVARFDAAVPRAPGEGAADAPVLERLERTVSAAGTPELVARVRYQEAAADGDLFIEAADYSYIPVPVRDGEENGAVRFRVDLAKAAKGAAAPGKTLILTIVSPSGSTEMKLVAD